MLHRRCPMGVFSHDEAFYYYGLTDREPLVHTLTIYSGYNVHRLKEDGYKVYPAISGSFGFDRSILNILITHSYAMFIFQFYNTWLALDFKYKKFLVVSGINSIGGTLLSIFLILVVFKEHKYIGRIYGYAIVPICVAAVIWLCFFRDAKKTKQVLFNTNYWKYGLSISLPLVVHTFSQQILSQFDRIMIGALVSVAAVGIYGFIQTIASILQIIVQSMDNAWSVWMYEQLDQKQYTQIQDKSKAYILLMNILYTQGIYKGVSDLLKRNEKVLFCGTPCQVAALRAYLGKEYDNLFLLDFICKGINSPKAYTAYINEIEHEYKSSIKCVRQKSKKTGWQSLATNIVFENGKEYHKDRYTDWWIQGYTCGNLFMRQNCQKCLYKTMPRQADLSFGDFWGIKSCSETDYEKGISVVFINSQKGMQLLENVNDKIHLENRSLEEVLAGNPYLFGQAVQKGNRKKFFELLNTEPFSKAVKSTYTENPEQKLKRYTKLFLKRVLKRKKW